MPTEPLARALRHLTPHELAVARCVCRLFRDAVSSVMATEDCYQKANITLSPDTVV